MLHEIPTDNLIGGQWQTGSGAELVSMNPSHPGEVVWRGRQASPDQVAQAVMAARTAQPTWFRQPLEQRIAICRAFANYTRQRSNELAELISQETGKPRWDARTEVAAVVGKIDLSVEALRSRRDTQQFEMPGAMAVTRFKPHGVLAVLGPFNFPAHLPNGHIVPALLAGNTVAFKPSEQTPAVGAWMAQAWKSVGLPDGVLNLVQGERLVGQALVSHPQIDGLLFTGSSAGGRALHRAWADAPDKILALEMGGNNPLVVCQIDNQEAAVYHTIMSAYVSAGQRCTCARRLIIVEDDSTRSFLDRLMERIGRVQVGYYDDDTEPFLGTVIHAQSGLAIAEAFERLTSIGGKVLYPLQSQRGNSALLTPGLVDVTGVSDLSDEEVFGPLLTVFRVPDFDTALRLANGTRYGLSAGLLSASRELFEQFVAEIRAGIVNWNRQTTGASGRLPFGGCGWSGNHRPAGYYSADYCSYPVASLEVGQLAVPDNMEPGLNW
ncbi:MAG TPA: succinylglutamate-semialdehyde dehydrogenase [Pirellulaceae bacterium]|nr:succinylglutamate-semialdehyde dehydrogenase [Pirellulaceae bacterium]